MLADYLGIALVLIVGALLVAAARLAQRVLAPRPPAPPAPPARGVSTPPPARRRVPVKFFLVALLFVVFNVQASFLYPWATVLRELGGAGFVAILVFSVPLVVGLVFQRAKGGLEW